MKTAFICVLFQTSESEQKRLKKEASIFDEVIFIDNTSLGKGYGYGVNLGIKKGLKTQAGIFVITNPDISFKDIKISDIKKVAEQFDIGGFEYFLPYN